MTSLTHAYPATLFSIRLWSRRLANGRQFHVHTLVVDEPWKTLIRCRNRFSVYFVFFLAVSASFSPSLYSSIVLPHLLSLLLSLPLVLSLPCSLFPAFSPHFSLFLSRLPCPSCSLLLSLSWSLSWSPSRSNSICPPSPSHSSLSSLYTPNADTVSLNRSVSAPYTSHLL